MSITFPAPTHTLVVKITTITATARWRRFTRNPQPKIEQIYKLTTRRGATRCLLVDLLYFGDQQRHTVILRSCKCVIHTEKRVIRPGQAPISPHSRLTCIGWRAKSPSALSPSPNHSLPSFLIYTLNTEQPIRYLARPVLFVHAKKKKHRVV